jgi:hypothetical protein
MTDKIRFISEDQARRLWERAAELQAEAAQREEEARRSLPSSSSPHSPVSEEEEGAGYSLTHVQQAGLEAGIHPEFLNMALAEEAVLELEGGGEDRSFDRAVERFLGDRRRALELTQDFKFPARPVWLALEQVFLSDPHDLELLEIRGGEVGDGGIAIFEAPTSMTGDGSLKFYSTAVDTKRYLVRVTPAEDGGCQVLIRIPLRRSRRISGGVGMGVAGGVGILGGLGGMALVVALGSGGLAALPLALVLAGGGVGGAAGAGALTRWGGNAIYQSYMRKLERTLRKILTRVERDLEREATEKRGGLRGH